jgi:MraZ protein
MLIGEHAHAIDDKGRLQVPAKWRSLLAGGAVVTKGFDGSLKCYPMLVWEDIAAKLVQLPQSQPDARAFVRQTLAGAVDVELDKSGRMLLPQYLRSFAGLSKQVTLAGLADHFEIWDEATWQRYQEAIDPSSPNYSQTLKEIGI